MFASLNRVPSAGFSLQRPSESIFPKHFATSVAMHMSISVYSNMLFKWICIDNVYMDVWMCFSINDRKYLRCTSVLLKICFVCRSHQEGRGGWSGRGLEPVPIKSSIGCLVPPIHSLLSPLDCMSRIDAACLQFEFEIGALSAP